MNIFIVHHRSSHHAKNSGYGRLIDFLPSQVIYGDQNIPYRLAKWIAALHSKSKGDYNSGSVFKTIELYRNLSWHKNEINVVHFLNGERDIRHLKFFKKRFPNTRFCATFHKPPDILTQSIPDPSALRLLDGAICVGANQAAFLKEWLQLENVKYIPHGVDTGFFYYDPHEEKSDFILFVGQHLRDFKMLNTTLPVLFSKFPGLQLKAVVHKAYTDRFISHPQIEIYSKIPDTELRELYQKAKILYLPMEDSTACNSLLEALACGLPIITSDVGGNAEYLRGTKNILIPPGEKAETKFVQEAIRWLKASGGVLEEISRFSREKAMMYEWEKISSQKMKFYHELNVLK